MCPALASALVFFAGVGVNTLMRVSEESDGDGRRRRSGAGIVVDDGEDVNVVDAEVGLAPMSAGTLASEATSVYTDAQEEHEPGAEANRDQEHEHEHGQDEHEDPASVLARNRALVRDSLQSGESHTSVASSAVSSIGSEVSREMRRMEADLASAGTFSNAGVELLAALEERQRTPTAEGFGDGSTQPLRIPQLVLRLRRLRRLYRERSSSSRHNHDRPFNSGRRQYSKCTNSSLSRKASPSRVLLLNSNRQQQQMLFLPHPNAPRPNPAVLSGQRQSTYGMLPTHAPQPVAPITSPAGALQPNSLVATMRAAAGVSPVSRPTIYGRTVV